MYFLSLKIDRQSKSVIKKKRLYRGRVCECGGGGDSSDLIENIRGHVV